MTCPSYRKETATDGSCCTWCSTVSPHRPKARRHAGSPGGSRWPWTLALVFGLAACGGSGGGGGTPPSGISLVVGGGVMQPSLNPTLLAAEVLFDGQVLNRQQITPATWQLVPQGSKSNVSRGAHTVGFRIVNQTTSPTDYEINGLVNANDLNGGTQNILLGPLTQSLATGDVVTFNVMIDP